MASSNYMKLMILFCITYIVAGDGSNYLDVEPPNFFIYNSPLLQPDSLRSRPYFDFLSTLYRRDVDKSSLFRTRPVTRRDVATLIAPAATAEQELKHRRTRRAVVFRPLFVYRQQQIKRKRINSNRV